MPEHTPLEIEIALHYQTHRDVDFPKNVGEIREMCAAGLLRRRGNSNKPRYEATPGLALYVQALCAVPWPEQRWVMPESEEEP